jgi:hypothetical protein
MRGNRIVGGMDVYFTSSAKPSSALCRKTTVAAYLDVVALVRAAVLPEEAVPDGLVGVQEVQERVSVLAQAGGEENHLKDRERGRLETGRRTPSRP